MAGLKNKKHLFFDLDDTLWDFEKNSSAVLKELFVEFELQEKFQASFADFYKAYKSINQALWLQYYAKVIDKTFLRNQRFYKTFKHFNVDDEAMSHRFNEQYLGRAPHGKQLKAGCLEALDYLQNKYQLHIITNGFEETQQIKLDGCGLASYFSQVIISEQHQLTKPDEKIFRLAETLTGAAAHECVMIGDNLECDVQGALNAGWEPVYFSERGHSFKGKAISSLLELKEMF